jgi:transcriptional regulator with XRE-family HTH domain
LHLRSARETLEVQQTELARDVNMDPTNYAKIERGQKNVTIETLVRIAKGLGVTLVVRFAPKRRGAGAR